MGTQADVTLNLPSLDLGSISDDPEAMLKQLEDESGQGATATPGGDTPPAGDSDEGKGAKEEPVIKTGSGQEIPYAVLKAEREKSRQLEERLAAAERQLAEKQAGQPPAEPIEPPPAAEEPLVSDEDLEALRETAPTFANVLEAVIKQNKALETRLASVSAQVKPVVEKVEHDEQEAFLKAQNEANEARDRNPVLRYWLHNDPKMMDRASALDAVYRQDPDLAQLSYDERFSKVVASLEATFGKTELPPEYLTSSHIKERAKEAADNARRTSPRTLSDMPGGAPPARDTQESIEQMSMAQLGNLAMSMDDPVKLAEMLEKLG